MSFSIASLLDKVDNINFKFQIVQDKLPVEQSEHIGKAIKAASLMKQMIELMDVDINEEIPEDALPPEVSSMLNTYVSQLSLLEIEAQKLVNEYFPAGT